MSAPASPGKQATSSYQSPHRSTPTASTSASRNSPHPTLEQYDDEDSGDIALSIPRARSNRALAASLNRPRSMISSASTYSPISRTPIVSSALARSARAEPASAPVSPLEKSPRDNFHSMAASTSAARALPVKSRSSSSDQAADPFMSSTPPRTHLASSTASASAPATAPASAPATSQTPTTPPRRTPTITTITASPDRPVSPTLHTRRARKKSQSSLSLRIPGGAPPRVNTSNVADPGEDLDLDLDSDPSPARPPPLIGEETVLLMSRWVKEVVVCNFDLERGPVVERRAVGRRWGKGLKENVAFSSFPDTSLFTEGSIQFSFKIRDVAPTQAALAFPEPPSPQPDRTGGPVLKHQRGNSLHREKAAEYREWDERGREWLYGYVWFQQNKDSGIARGFMQKSVVILTHLPLPALFSEVLSKVGPAFFKFGYSALEVACHSIAAWPDPRPDALLELPLLTDVLTVKLPDSTENPQMEGASRDSEPILAALPASTPLRAFAKFLPSLWSIWECLVLAEPLLIIAPDPKTCSEIVWWLRELVRPIPLAGDFRPYLHIHDQDFSLLVNANKPQAGVVVGVTNPFFRNAASHWPNVISILGDRTKPKGPGVKQEMTEGFVSKRSRSVSKDRPLLKKLEALVAAGKLDDPAGNAALRTHFHQLTERMLVPLNRYFQTLVPPRSSLPTTPSGLSPHPANSHNSPQLMQLQHPKPLRQGSGQLSTMSPLTLSINGNLTPVLPASPAVQTLKPFSLPNFLAHLRTHGPNPLAFKSRGITSKARTESDFYAAFCKSTTFATWLAARVEVLGLAVASNMLEDAIAAAGAMRLSPDSHADRSNRSSTEASFTTTDSTTSTSTSISPSSDHDHDLDIDTPRPRTDVLDPFTNRRTASEVFGSPSARATQATPTSSRPHPQRDLR